VGPHLLDGDMVDFTRYSDYPSSVGGDPTMANVLMPSNRTTPINAYIALRAQGTFANVQKVRGVTQATTAAGPQNGQGIGGPRCGGTTSLQALGGF
jgi:hypothetical protein